MSENPMEWHSSGRPPPTAASNSTKTTTGQTPRTPQICRGNISGQKRCNRQWHTSWHQSSPAIATVEQNVSPHNLSTVGSGKKPPRSSVAPQSSDILCAKLPSSRESSTPKARAATTRSRAPEPPPHPPRRTGYHRSKETASPSSILPAADQEALPRADPARAPAPVPASPVSAPAIARRACKTGTPRQRKATPARAAPSRPYTHSPAKSSPSSTLCALYAFFSVTSVLSFFPLFPRLSTLNFQLLTAVFPSSVITFPRSFTTPFNAPVGIRIISSNNPVIAVKNSSMLSSRSRVYASPRASDFTSCTHSASTFSVGSISRRFRSSETIRKISHTSLIDSKWSRRSPSTCTTRTIRQPCSSRRLVLTFERATASVVEISSAGTGRGDKNSSACTCATVRLIPHRVPISPQCKMNFCATGVSPLLVGSLIFAFPCLASFLPILSHLLFQLIQKLQFIPLPVKLFLPLGVRPPRCRFFRLNRAPPGDSPLHSNSGNNSIPRASVASTLTLNPGCPMVLRKESGSRKLPPTLNDFRFGGIPCH